jgi:CubicO group peptidase (beta-lactamase class C family)
VVRDLFIHTSGIGYRHDRETVIGRRYIEAAPYEKSASLEDAVETLASLPLYFDPGERVFYGYSTEVLGRIVEVVSGQPFDEYVTDTILQPLGMADTSFFVPEADEGRLASVVQKSGDGSLQAVRGDVFGDPLSEYTWPSPGAGLVSTAPDYLRFAMMLERGGELDGVRIVSRQSVELMTTDHLPESIRQRIEGTPLAGRGFGLGVAVTLDSKVASDPGRDGDYTWSGFYDTQFFVSPTTETVAVMMVQRQPRDDEPDRQTGRRFKEAVFRVLDQNSQE